MSGYADAGGAVVGHLPQGLPGLQWPGLLPWADFSSLLMPVLVITLVSFSGDRLQRQQREPALWRTLE